MTERLDVAQEFAKAAIGTGVDIFVPGLGTALVVLARSRPQSFNREVAKALDRAIREVAARPEARNRLQRVAYGAQSRFRRAPPLVPRGWRYDALFDRVEPLFSPEATTDEPPVLSKRTVLDQIHAQWRLAFTRAPIGLTWEARLAGLLVELVERLLGEGDDGRKKVDKLLGRAEDEGDPGRPELRAWSQTVALVFAAELARSEQLRPLAERLDAENARSHSNLLLWQLDHARRSMHLVTGAVLVIALVFSIHTWA